MIVAGEVPLDLLEAQDDLARRRASAAPATMTRSTASTTPGSTPRSSPLDLDDPRLAAAAKRDKHVRAFLFWSRMPMV